MDLPKLIILICCTYTGVVAMSTHNIPVNEYKTELQDLGQHVEYPETPVKVIKITKTIAVKIPVPYPVKVIEKVPYPVHVSKPYPVPVPQIVHVPHGAPAPAHGHPAPPAHAGPAPHEPLSYHAPSEDDNPSHPSADAYYGPPGGGGGDHDAGSFEVKSYDEAYNEYLKKHGGESQDHLGGIHYR